MATMPSTMPIGDAGASRACRPARCAARSRRATHPACRTASSIARRIAADPSDRVGAPQTVPLLIEIAGLQIARDDAAGRGAASERGAFLVRPEHHLQRMPCARRPRACTACITSSAASVPRSPSKLPPDGHRVDVRAEQNRQARGRGCRPRAKTLPAGSTRGVRPAPLISPSSQARAARSASNRRPG